MVGRSAKKTHIMFDSSLGKVISTSGPRGLSSGALSLIFCLVGLFFLTAYQILVPLGLDEVNPITSGFHDDRNYVSNDAVIKRLDDYYFINNGYWYISYVAMLLMPSNWVFLLKLINLIFLSLTYHTTLKLAEKLASVKIYCGLFYLFIPTLAVVSKEWFSIFLCIKLVDVYTASKTSIYRFALLVIFGFLLLCTKYVYFFIMIALMLLSRGLYSKTRILGYGIAASLFLALIFNYLPLFADELIILRFIEMSSEGANYGINSVAGTLSDRFSGSTFYSFFQFFVLPIPAKFNALYNYFFPLMPFFMCSIGYICINFRDIFKRFTALFVIFFSYSFLVILINFGANYRYKLLPIMLAFILISVHGEGSRSFRIYILFSFIFLMSYFIMGYFRF